jgi:hypothetical protein
MRMTTKLGELQGSCYMEVLPGTYKGNCWNEGALFFTEDVFKYFEPFIKKRVTAYDHHGVTEIPKAQWLAILDDIAEVGISLVSSSSLASLDSRLGTILREVDEKFVSALDNNRVEISQLYSDFSRWIQHEFRLHGIVTILGI